MERYESYKDSGVQWLGEIPGHWECIKMKFLLQERSEKNHPEEEILCATQKYGVIPQKLYCSYGNRVVEVNKGFEKLKFVRVGDFVIHLRSFQGGIEYAYYQGICSAAYTILYPKEKGNTQYFKHLFKSDKFILLLKTCVTGIREGQNINYPLLSTKHIPLPPLSEQQSIVSFLDSKCSKIDEWIEKKQKEVELLGELKQRLIADAVTRGLNPDVKMKPTNIPWLPDVPEHWEIVKLKAFCKDNKEKNKDGKENCVLSLSYGNVIVKKDVNFGLIPDNYDSYQIVHPGYIILRLTDLQNDHRSLRTGLVKNKGIITSAYVGLVVQNIDSEYTHYLLHAYDIFKLFYSMGGGLRQSMSYQDVANLYIPVPHLSEQQAIVSYINERIAKTDTLINNLNKEIEQLKEYKQRLISDVVTGQIKVC